MKIMIAIPSMDSVPIQFAISLATLNKVDDCFIANKTGSLVYMAREELAKQAIQMEADYVLWLDSDMMFAPDTLQRLIADLEKGDIVSGLYFRRQPPFTPVLFPKLEFDGKTPDFTNLPDKLPDDIFEVGGVGFGCVLMPVDAIISVLAKYGELFTPYQTLGEDVAFCWRVRQCGYKIVVDPKIKLGHVGNYIVTESYYKAYKEGGQV